MRQLIILILSLSVIFPGPTWAKGGATFYRPADLAQRARYFKSVDRILARQRAAVIANHLSREEIGRKIKRGQARAHGPQFASHAGQTIMMLWIVSSVHAVYQAHKLDVLQKDRPADAQLILEVADHMINNFSVFSSIVGATAASQGLKLPLQAIQGVIASKVGVEILRKLLIQGVGGFVSFVGWEAGKQLFDEAKYMLEDEAEIKAAGELRFMEVITGRSGLLQYKVLGKLMVNAFSIMAYVGSERNRMWIYNTWRLACGTGEFWVMLTAMVGAGVAAGTVAPGVGNTIGLLFGFVVGVGAGIGAMFLPHDYVQPITDGVVRMRIKGNESSMRLNSRDLLRLLQEWRHPIAGHRMLVDEYLTARGKYRNAIITALFEAIYGSYVRMQEAEKILLIITLQKVSTMSVAEITDAFLSTGETSALKITDVNVAELKAEYEKQYQEEFKRVRFYFDEAMALQEKEARRFYGIATDKDLRPGLAEVFMDHYDKQSYVHAALRDVYIGLAPEKAQMFGYEELSDADVEAYRIDAEILLNLFRNRSFYEADFLEVSP